MKYEYLSIKDQIFEKYVLVDEDNKVYYISNLTDYVSGKEILIAVDLISGESAIYDFRNNYNDHLDHKFDKYKNIKQVYLNIYDYFRKTPKFIRRKDNTWEER